jgi:hypothetical protein
MLAQPSIRIKATQMRRCWAPILLFGLIVTALIPNLALARTVMNLTAGPPSGKGVVSIGNPLWKIPLRLMPVTRERPLFSPSRRPPQAPVAFAPPPPKPPPKRTEPDHPTLALVGTVISKAQNIAIFADPATKKFIRLTIAEGHGGWTLREIRSRQVIFEKDRRSASLSLQTKTNLQLDALAQKNLPQSSPKPPWLVAAQNPPPQPTNGSPGEQNARTIKPDAPKPPWMTAAESPPPPLSAAVQAAEVGAHAVSADSPKPPWLKGGITTALTPDH